MEIARLLTRHHRIALDTCIFIYHMERNSTYFEAANAVFARMEISDTIAFTSTVAMAEILVQPYKHADFRLAADLYTLLTTVTNLEWVPPSLEIANSAASLRATYRLQMPDALIAATAIHSRASALITNDPIFARIPGFDTLVLDQFV